MKGYWKKFVIAADRKTRMIAAYRKTRMIAAYPKMTSDAVANAA